MGPPTPEEVEIVFAALKHDTDDGLHGDAYEHGAYDILRWLRGEQECPFIYLEAPAPPTHPAPDPPLPAEAWDPKATWHTDADM